MHTPVKQPAETQPDNRTYNALLCDLRGPGERGFALLTQRRRTLQHLTTSPRRIGDIAAAALTLTHYEHGMI